MKHSDTVHITVIVDNSALPGFASEHGFSLWIETRGVKILFDAGLGSAFSRNRERLGIDLSETDWLVLSHGHYDHTGSIAPALEAAPKAKVCLHPGAFTDRWSIREGVAKPTMMPEASRLAIRALPEERVVYADGPVELAPGVHVTGPVPRRNAFEDPGGPFFLDTEGMRPDPIEDDLSLFVETAEGISVIAGCCHSGILNTLEHIFTLTPERRVAAVMGGLHLSKATDDRIVNTAEGLRRLNVRRVVTSHCTGEGATERFRELLACPVEASRAGMRLTLP
jgi:7,8-dihydropterin-6-yl-methyl-4-(beta-D-ribofuranosyl)aminobenzene 5'-phosphate synthase